jgi:hypothetical protein
MALVVSLFTAALQAEADPQGERSIAMEEVRVASQAEVLAVGCGLRLNTQLRDVLRNNATIRLSDDAFLSMEQFARTYTLNLLHRHHRGICAHALERFGPEGDQIQGLLLH